MVCAIDNSVDAPLVTTCAKALFIRESAAGVDEIGFTERCRVQRSPPLDICKSDSKLCDIFVPLIRQPVLAANSATAKAHPIFFFKFVEPLLKIRVRL